MATRKRSKLSERTDPLRIGWYGDPGTRKTTHASTAAKFGEILVVAAEPGLKASALRQHDIDPERIEVFPEPGVEITYETLYALYWEVKERISGGEDIFALVIDTITETQGHLVRDVVETQVGHLTRKAQALYEAGDTTAMENLRSEFDVYLEDYGEVSQQMRKLVRKLCDLPCHLLVTAHARRFTEADGGLYVAPSAMASVSSDLVAYMDFVIRTYVTSTDGVTEGLGRTSPVGRYIAKDRYGVLPPIMVDPTFERILAYTQGKLDRNTDPLQIAAKERRAAEAKAAQAAAVQATAAADPKPNTNKTRTR